MTGLRRVSTFTAVFAANGLLSPKTALAYVGPGAGAGGSSIGVTSLIIMATVGLIGLGLACALIAGLVRAAMAIRKSLLRKAQTK